MKNLIFKIFAGLFALSFATSIFAISYTNNTYQKLADEYTKKAQIAFDAGEYDLAVEYSSKAQENAELSKQFVAGLQPQKDAKTQLEAAQKKLDWAKSVGADQNYPAAFSQAQQYYTAAKEAYDAGDWQKATSLAQQSLQALSNVQDVTPLPEYYIVRPWSESKDCFWNIAGRTYVYNNPRLWENLFDANKGILPNPNNPDLLMPGAKLKIPSIKGETREGVFDPQKKYPTFGVQ